VKRSVGMNISLCWAMMKRLIQKHKLKFTLLY
jgi:hypothetical protein